MHVGNSLLQEGIHETNLSLATIISEHITMVLVTISLHIDYLPADLSVGYGRREQVESSFLCAVPLQVESSLLCAVPLLHDRRVSYITQVIVEQIFVSVSDSTRGNLVTYIKMSPTFGIF